ncbi:Pyruvate/Phosphoenolpyruvate kinase-like domain-containing protein [Aspergillus leporis]|jgi:4-hydroxy-2-oxoheptanedioate aldolase|uniref:Pyruvate/Phosphoenolpyruvate kinase-like domain-containing protein n=1 Tax=Aspergillus leporis TaxID=41062 RepID=A0A5N5WTG7_9EURO|nr:Pyruvate/Phosphoenolpyruvate kinase-like domain-containing protein [Aspergillus leporis]
MLPGTALTRSICRSASNLDWLLIDQGHGNISDGIMYEIVAATAACGASRPLSAFPQHWMIKRIRRQRARNVGLCLGTAEDARNVVRFSKVPPEGNRGFESLLAVDKFVGQHPHGGVKQLTSVEYLQQANSSLVIAVQIETKATLENEEKIAAVPGIDVLFIGPFDLAINIGHPILDPARMVQELVQTIQSIRDAAHAASKAVDIYCDTGEQATAYANRGFHMMSAMADIVGIWKVFSQAFDATR